MSQFYTYLHCRPNGDPFYVGKGTLRRSKLLSSRNPHYKNIVAKYGAENIGIYAFLCDSEEQALADEVRWIAQLRNEGIELTNRTDGGEGVTGWVPSEKELLRRSLFFKGKSNKSAIGNKYRLGTKHTPETRAKMSAALKGRIGPRLGQEVSQETRRKMSLAKLGKVTWNIGKKLSPEARARLSEAHKGIRPSKETLLKKSLAMKGKPWSAARRAAHERSQSA